MAAMTESAAAFDIDIRIDAAGWRSPEIAAEARAGEAARAAIEYSQVAAEALELSILLTDDSAVARLNREWRGKSGPTNVLSFPGETPPDAGSETGMPILLGDIAIAFETVVAESDAAGIPITDHLRHLVVHGVLHLLGYDHENDKDADRMERCEVEILDALGVSDPYAAADRRLEHVPR